jgi:hypothetical protein
MGLLWDYHLTSFCVERTIEPRYNQSGLGEVRKCWQLSLLSRTPIGSNQM